MSRDDQFKDFAERLFEELKPDLVLLCVELGRRNTAGILQSEEIIKQQLARRAYDLVAHTIGHSLEYLDECGKEISGSMGKRIIPTIPDMAELPEDNNASTD